MTFLFSLIFACIGFFILYFSLAHLIDKKISSKNVMDSLEEKIEGLLVFMNDAVDQNISIVDEKIKNLRSIIDLADRKIKVLEKEQVKFEQGKNTYQELVKRKPLINSVVDLKKEETHTTPKTEGELFTLSNLGSSKNTYQTDIKKNTTAAPMSAIDKRKEISSYVLQMFKEGKSPQEIAGQLNIALAEAELIISLHINQKGYSS